MAAAVLGLSGRKRHRHHENPHAGPESSEGRGTSRSRETSVAGKEVVRNWRVPAHGAQKLRVLNQGSRSCVFFLVKSSKPKN